MRHIIFEHIKDTEKILADCISHLGCMKLYDSPDPEGEGKEFGHNIFEELPTSSIVHLTQAEQDEIKVHEIQHVPLKLDQEEIKNYNRHPVL